ncbi:methyltransferase, FxLD system [Streptomyces sp. SID3343]|uniref:methyltransferase, FxLD system n=1 Tax=Streptomyces sp. SID3343 TaxID=2690260 RepID=UPI00136DED51|nr:methyltransferase, FxLD system [Streptomyces sp. SID3343]MYV98363.1 methyltransferase, FxLD system [Streptomyces sp. SID3343]
MTDVTEQDSGAGSDRAAHLRERMVAELIGNGDIVSGPVEAAMRTVAREVFVPEVGLEDAYNAYDAVVTKRDGNGNAVSSVSAPQAQAAMLEQADLGPGMRVLEVGSGGCNAAYLAELVGPTGAVVSVDIDEDVVERARRLLAKAGYPRVDVVLADAELGVPEHAPYDRILVTAGAWDVPPAWFSQLVEGGVLVAPLRVRGLTRTVSLALADGHLSSRSTRLFGFVPMRGTGAHDGMLWELRDGEIGLRFDDVFDGDPALLKDVFDGERTDVWSGATIGRTELLATVQMWLATALPGFCTVVVDKARATGVVSLPGNRTSALGAVDGANLAYVTTRATDDEDLVEFGVHAYGPQALRLAEETAEHLRTWSRVHRGGPGPRITVHPAGTADDELPDGRVVDKTHSRVTISWPIAANVAPGREALHHPTE